MGQNLGVTYSTANVAGKNQFPNQTKKVPYSRLVPKIMGLVTLPSNVADFHVTCEWSVPWSR